MPAIKIEKQDRRPPVDMTLKLSAGIAARLRLYASQMESDESYVAEQIFRETLPVEKTETAKTDKGNTSKSAIGKVA